MSKTNISFMNAYIELDTVCSCAMEVKRGGVSAYIRELEQMERTDETKELLVTLKKYRSIRNRLAHEKDAINGTGIVERADIKWLRSFAKRVREKKDIISRSARQKRAAELVSRMRPLLIVAVAAIAVICVAAAVISLT